MFLELPCSTALWPLCIHMNVASMYDILRSSVVWPLSHTDITVPLVVFSSQWLQIELQYGVSKRKFEVVHRPQVGSGCLLVAIIGWRGFACESSNLFGDSNSDFEHVCVAAIKFLIFSVFPSSTTKLSLVVRVITRSVLNHQLVCGVLINIFKTTQHRLPNKNAHEILFADVTRCVFLVGWDLFYLLAVSYESLLLDLFELRSKVSILTCPPSQGSPVSCFMVYDVFQIAESIFTSPLWVHKQILSLPPTLQIVPWMFFSTTIFHLGFYCVIYKAQFGALSYSDVMVVA